MTQAAAAGLSFMERKAIGQHSGLSSDSSRVQNTANVWFSYLKKEAAGQRFELSKATQAA